MQTKQHYCTQLEFNLNLFSVQPFMLSSEHLTSIADTHFYQLDLPVQTRSQKHIASIVP